MSMPSVVSSTSSCRDRQLNIVSAGASGRLDLTAQWLSPPPIGSHRNAGRPRQHVRLGNEAAQVTFLDYVSRLGVSFVGDLTLARCRLEGPSPTSRRGLTFTNLVSSHLNLELTLVCSDISLRHRPDLAIMLTSLTMKASKMFFEAALNLNSGVCISRPTWHAARGNRFCQRGTRRTWPSKSGLRSSTPQRSYLEWQPFSVYAGIRLGNDDKLTW
ncbi:hypothetical protein BDZ89DRAFT_1145572 [Hymenopellis radicata]|nr:hypothetical protein BDZ89DRAFT_1145572 [Hymenopellis radicata]